MRGTHCGSYCRLSINPSGFSSGKVSARAILRPMVCGPLKLLNESFGKRQKPGAPDRLKSCKLASRNINVSCVAPGLIETDMMKDVLMGQMLQAIPTDRTGTPGKVAAVVRFLMSVNASYVTRQVINVNGGLC